MPESEDTMTRYLLGELSEAEQSALEQAYFTYRSVFDQVVKLENRLVDGYVRGELSAQKRTRLEQYYLAHPQRRERVKFAEALAAKLSQLEAARSTERSMSVESWWARLLASAQSPRLALGFAMVLLLIAVGGVWFFAETRRLHRELAETQAERSKQEQREQALQKQIADERLRAEQATAELNRLHTEQQSSSTAPSQPAFVSFLLMVGGVRGADTGPPAVLVIPSGTEQVHLQLKLKESDYQSYRAVLQPVGGKEIFSRANLKAKLARSGASISFVVPAGKFDTGDYVLTLKGVTQTGEVEDMSKSIFHVEKK